jgi:predicted lipoprotein with Yx(FWY)xxD motif
MRAIGVAALLAAGLLLGACGSDEGGGDTGADTGGSADTVQVAETSLGEVLTDGDGMTLYLFTQDEQGTQDQEASSSCEGDCLAAWPPLEGEQAAGDGVDESLLGTIERSDGSTQATYNGHPLYYYAEDSDEGDVAGQGVNDVWWAVDAAGDAVETAPEETGSSGGY